MAKPRTPTRRVRLEPDEPDGWVTSRRGRVRDPDPDPARDVDADDVNLKPDDANGSARSIVGVNGNILVRAGSGRPAGGTNAVTREVATGMGLAPYQRLSTAQVKRAIVEVVEFLGYDQAPTDKEIREFLGPGSGGHKGFLLRMALTRRRSFERLYEKAFIPQQIKADLDPNGFTARLLQAAAAQKALLLNGSNGQANGAKAIDVTPTRAWGRSYDS